MPGSKWGDLLYAEYQTGQQIEKDIDFDFITFKEMYNMSVDPWSMHNLLNNTYGTHETPAITALADELHTQLHTWFKCTGDECD